MADAAKKTEESGAASGGGGSKIVPLLLGLNSLLLTGVLVLVAFRPQGLGHPAAPPAEAGGHEGKAEAKGEKPEKPGEKGEKGHGEGEKSEKAAQGGEKGEHGAKGAPGPTLRLPDFVVHLRDTDTDRYARISFEVEVEDEKGKEAVTARMPQIRDAFLSYLSDRSADELRGGEGIGKVKGILTDKLLEVAPGSGVRALYVTELVVQ